MNNLSGNIPAGETNLSGLHAMNLSGNQLTGTIPNNIGDLKHLEILDLSCNHLEGPIPISMTLLSHLNLSHNNLSGPIPSANQFQTFNDPSIYEGNLVLCGSPLPAVCSDSKPLGEKDIRGNVEDDDLDKLWFYVSIGLGFIVGFWAVCGGLVINKSWRESYFRFLDNVKDRLLLLIAMNVARFRRMRVRWNTK
ncbi:hypothetical protein FNV43_RR25795 [Rhamnella rubrinervis]|uniref:Uncharacterized protein n=1 Tax=Rhamnella rubrinervis TaxID=2594499 RepID=A0A8K0GQV8_9ROSA|nr:hypothetical protein FNV43_RR25795 [Rhamnella rubrinervis]